MAKVKEVYKIFGEKPEMALKYVLDGISKTFLNLLDRDINILLALLKYNSLDICEGEVPNCLLWIL